MEPLNRVAAERLQREEAAKRERDRRRNEGDRDALKVSDPGTNSVMFTGLETTASARKAVFGASTSTGQRAKAQAVLEEVAAQHPVSCASVALRVVEPFHQISEDVQAGQIGDHYDQDIRHILVLAPSEENLWNMAYTETRFWHSERGSAAGRAMTDDRRYGLLVAARDKYFPDWEARAATAIAPTATPQQAQPEPGPEPEPTYATNSGGTPMTEGAGAAATEGFWEGVAKGAINLAVSNVINNAGAIISAAGGALQVTGTDPSAYVTTIPDDHMAYLDRGRKPVSQRLMVGLNNAYRVCGQYQPQSGGAQARMDSDVPSWINLAISYQWGWQTVADDSSCLHVYGLNLVPVAIRNPFFTEWNIDVHTSTLSPDQFNPVAGIRISLTVGEKYVFWNSSKTLVIDLYGDGTIATIPGILSRGAQIDASGPVQQDDGGEGAQSAATAPPADDWRAAADEQFERTNPF
ncbi:MAG: hypothetical protein ACR2N4_15100 [Jatrophihabitans sp.]